MDLNKRMRTNPFYRDAVRMLGKANFHLIRPVNGPAGSIDLEVEVVDRQGKEVIKTFNFPAVAKGMAMMQWKAGFSRDIHEMELSGFRPNPKQFERIAESTRQATGSVERAAAEIKREPPIEPPRPANDTVTAEQVALHEEFASDETPEVPTPILVVRLLSPLATLVTLMGLHEDVRVVDGKLMEVDLEVPQASLSEFLAHVGQSEAKFIGAAPPKPRVTAGAVAPIEREPELLIVAEKPVRASRPLKDNMPRKGKQFPVTPAILQAMPKNKVVNARDIIDGILERHPKAPADYLKTKVPQVLAALLKQKRQRVERVASGQYKRVK